MIIVSRTTQFSNKFVPIGIYIDGEKVGSLRDGQQSEFRLSSGEHTIQARVNISASNSISFNSDGKQVIHFVLGSNVNVIKNILIALSHPALLIALFLLDKVINWDYFLVSALSVFILYEALTYLSRRRKSKNLSESEKYYLYLRRL